MTQIPVQGGGGGGGWREGVCGRMCVRRIAQLVFCVCVCVHRDAYAQKYVQESVWNSIDVDVLLHNYMIKDC